MSSPRYAEDHDAEERQMQHARSQQRQRDRHAARDCRGRRACPSAYRRRSGTRPRPAHRRCCGSSIPASRRSSRRRQSRWSWPKDCRPWRTATTSGCRAAIIVRPTMRPISGTSTEKRRASATPRRILPCPMDLPTMMTQALPRPTIERKGKFGKRLEDGHARVIFIAHVGVDAVERQHAERPQSFVRA